MKGNRVKETGKSCNSRPVISAWFWKIENGWCAGMGIQYIPCLSGWETGGITLRPPAHRLLDAI